jgi:hypothetical protein
MGFSWDFMGCLRGFLGDGWGLNGISIGFSWDLIGIHGLF